MSHGLTLRLNRCLIKEVDFNYAHFSIEAYNILF